MPIVILLAGEDLSFDRLEETLHHDLAAGGHYSDYANSCARLSG